MAKHFSKTLKKQIFNRDGHICKLCDTPYPLERLHIDHIKPKSLGGEATLENGMVVCDTCNRLKSTFYGEGLMWKIKWAEERLNFYKKIFKFQTGETYEEFING